MSKLEDLEAQLQALDKADPEYKKIRKSLRRKIKRAGSKSGIKTTKKKTNKVTLADLPAFFEATKQGLNEAGLVEQDWLSIEGLSPYGFALDRVLELKGDHQTLIEKFVARWSELPEWYVTSTQGDIPLILLGPVPNDVVG